MIPETLTVDVKTKHLEHGERYTCARCPIALAVLEAYPGLRVVVSCEYVLVHVAHGFDSRLFPMNERLGAWHAALLAGDRVGPITEELTR